jgi:membrane protease YdiL (CAAX protease family)
MIPTLVILILGPAALAVLIARGCLRADALDAGPSRSVGLMPHDLLVALGLMLIGPALVGSFMPPVGDLAENGAAEEIGTLTLAGLALLGQATSKLVPVLYLIWRATGEPGGLRKIGVVPTLPWRDVRWGVLGFVAVVPVVMAVIQSTVLIGEAFGHEAPALAHDMLRALVDSDSLLGSVLIVISAVVVAPVLEEAIFRGIVQSVLVETLGEGRRWAVVIFASGLFAFIHTGAVAWQALPGLFVLGLALGWLYERSGSLWPAIVLHMAFNALNILLALAATSAQAGTP